MTGRDFEELDALRWVSAVTAQARGEALAPEEREFKAAIEAGSPELHEEVDFWRAVAHQGESSRSGEMSDEDLAASVLAAFAAPTASGGPVGQSALEAFASADEQVSGDESAAAVAAAPRDHGHPGQAAPVLALGAHRRARYGLAAGVGVALAAAAALVIGVLGPFQIGPATSPADGGQAAIEPDLSEPPLDGYSGAVIPVEEDCVTLGPSSRACLEEGALEVVAALDGGEPRIRVDAGSLRVVSEEPVEGEVVASVVETPLATLHGRDASYEAMVAEAPLLLILVVDRGEVEVEQHDGTRRKVEAGETVTIRLPDGGAGVDELEALEDEAPDEPKLAQAPDAQEARQARAALLRAAQEHVQQGERGRAIKAYRQLVDEHSGSREARLARVSLGRLYLEDGQASRALVQFRKYLRRPGGQLREEALYGEIRALRALGRKDAEQQAIQRFLGSHPRSIYAAGLERRLDDGSGASERGPGSKQG